jgi:hypothetical protein
LFYRIVWHFIATHPIAQQPVVRALLDPKLSGIIQTLPCFLLKMKLEALDFDHLFHMSSKIRYGTFV